MPKTDNTSATDFCLSLPWELGDVLWQGRTGTYKLDDDRRVTITLTSYMVVDHYDGFTVEVTSKTAGPIASKRFKFDEHLDQALSARIDNRSDYPLGSNTCFEVIAYCGWSWYIAHPADPKQFTGAVEAWIEAWR